MAGYPPAYYGNKGSAILLGNESRGIDDIREGKPGDAADLSSGKRVSSRPPQDKRSSSRASRTGSNRQDDCKDNQQLPQEGSDSQGTHRKTSRAPVRRSQDTASEQDSRTPRTTSRIQDGVSLGLLRTPRTTSEHSSARRSQSREDGSGRRSEKGPSSEQKGPASTSTRRSGSLSNASSRRRSSSAARAAGARHGDALELKKKKAQDELARRMDEAAEHNFEAPDPAMRATATVKWNKARAFAELSPSIEAWSGGFPGTFMFIPDGASGTPPAFQHQVDRTKWLYLSSNGIWWLGAAAGDDRRQSAAQMPQLDKGLLRSAKVVTPGTLPHQVGAWQALVEGEWVPLSDFKFWLTENVAIEWLKLTIEVYDAPILSIWGTGESECDGLYDVVSRSGASVEPPIFRHQQFTEKWLFLSRDQRWCIGSTEAMKARANRGMVCSGFIQPGCHPKDAGKWEHHTPEGLAECGMEIQCLREAARASDKWALANERSANLEFWGKEMDFGDYLLVPTVMSEAPTYQHRTSKDVWVYMATDGCWWMSSTENKSKQLPKGWLQSELCEPGTLPQDVKTWSEGLDNGVWDANPLIKAMVNESIDIAWQQARQEVMDNPVVELQGVEELELDGFYDFVPTEGSKHMAPVFQHQIDQDLWIYVATDCRWWVGTFANMKRRLPRGKLRSSAMLPGTLPQKIKKWLVYDSDAKEFNVRDSVAVS